jgi:CHAD domain-containing protein
LSKSERGYALLEDQPPGPAKAEEPLLDRTMTAGKAFQVVARSCLRQLALNQGMLGESRDPDVLHQARVATRRLRAAISLFKAVLVDDRRDAINADLKWLARLLGEARDLDVFITKFLKPHDQADSVEDVEDLVAEYERQREDAYDRVLEALGSPRFRNLVLDLVAWIEAGPWLASDDPKAVARRTQPIDGYVAGVLAKRRKAIIRRGTNLDEIDDEARHQVRIRAKKLRYASEFLGSLYRRKRRKKREAFVAALESLQACLGELNDIVTAQQLGGDPDRSDDAGRGDAAQEGPRAGAGDHGSKSKSLLKKASRSHAEFVEAKPFWR